MVELESSQFPTRAAERLDNQQEKTERRVKTEKLKLIGTNAIVLYHSPGVGGSTLARMLADKIEGATFFDGGEEIRKSQGYTSSHTKYIQRPVGVDQNIDEIQMELMRTATPEHPVIIDAKLGGFNALRLMHENPSINVIPVLITCAQKTAAERMKKRTAKELEKKFNQYSNYVLSEIISEEVYEELLDDLRIEAENNTTENKIAETKRRIAEDRIQFTKAHGILKGVDLYNPGARVVVGYYMYEKTGKPKPRYEKLWKVKQSTTRLNPDEAFEELVDKLVSLGNVKRIRIPKKLKSELLVADGIKSKIEGIDRNSRSFGEPVSKRSSQHPNPYHPSRIKGKNQNTQ